MAELIQKKLQGEVEKYQQLQKGKRAELLWACPIHSHLKHTMMRRRAPSGAPCTASCRLPQYPRFLPRSQSRD